MQAVTVPVYGPPESLVLRDVEVPTLGEEDVLVDVVAASINTADSKIMRGEPFPLRLAMGLARPKLVALGADVSGRVRAVGSKVRDLSVGDEVIADLSGSGFGAFAEQVRAPARVWVRKPANLSHVEAAAVPMAGLTALKGLRDIAKVGPGDHVLVVGATGGVGTFAVQIARALGAEVTATSRAEKADLLEELGVTEIVDSSALDDRLASHAFQGRFQLVFDCAAFRSPFAFLGVLAKGGRYLQVGGAIGRGLQTALFGSVVGLVTGRSFGMMISSPNAQLLSDVVALIEAKQVRPIVDRVFPLLQAQEAIRHLEERHTRGKVILSIAD